jgi:hypothetical protein
VFGVAFGLFFSLFARPWKARDPRSRYYIGIGAFNLVRASAYRAAGTHQAIRLSVDDDMRLGKLLKRRGFRQDFVVGAGMMHVEWYGSLRETIDGLKKNSFPGLDYSIPKMLGGTLFHLAIYSLPWFAVWFTRGWTQALFGIAIVLMAALYAGAARAQGAPIRNVVLFPIVCLLFVFIVWNGTWYVLRTGGVEWRGTRYSLAELKANLF